MPGSIYIGGTLTRIDTELADSFTSPAGRSIPINSGRGAAVIFEQPKLRVTLDAGVRLFEEKLTLGGRVTDVSKTEPVLGSLRTGYEMAGYRVYDIYGSYAFDPNDEAALCGHQSHGRCLRAGPWRQLLRRARTNGNRIAQLQILGIPRSRAVDARFVRGANR